MKNYLKRSLSLLLALVMILSPFSGLTVKTYAEEVGATVAATEAAVEEAVAYSAYSFNTGIREEVCTELSAAAEAFYTDGYTYEELAELSGAAERNAVPASELYEALQTLMASRHTHETSYGETRYQYQYTDCQDGGNWENGKISSFYSGAAIGPDWDSGATWNREHTWPNSKGLGGNDENDIMMLRPTSKSENSSRSNKAYGQSAGYYNPNSESGGAYDVRGDVARIFLYTYVRWGNVNGNGKYTTWGTTGVMESEKVMLDWMEADPVDTWEMSRNDVVQEITGTRNVFVDYPELAFLLFNEEIPSTMTTPSGKAGMSGTCGDNLTWVLDDEGTLTISGNGLMEDFDRYDTAPWYEHREAVKKVVIQDGVTSIGTLAFHECVNLANVEIADTVTEIRLGAFWDCDSLLSIVIPDSVTTMEECFHNKLQSATLSNSLTMIDQGMFSNCTELTSIVIPEGVTSLEKGVFFGCENLESVILPSTLTKIGFEVFYGCTNLKEVNIPENVIEIDGDAFQNTGLTSIEIPASVTTIWEGAFRECANLTGIWVDEENENYSSDASGALLDKEQKTLIQVPGGLSGTYTVPGTVTTIGDFAFSACDSLANITIPDSVTSMGTYAFGFCTGLTEITFEGDAPEIAANVFKKVTATAYYPADNATWTADVMQNYGGNITWEAYGEVEDKPKLPVISGDSFVVDFNGAEYLQYLFTPAEDGNYLFYFDTWGGIGFSVCKNDNEEWIECGYWENPETDDRGISTYLLAGVEYRIVVHDKYGEGRNETIYVTKAVPYDNIWIETEDSICYVDNKVYLKLRGTPEFALERAEWTVSDPSVLEIYNSDATSLHMYSLAPGTVTVTVTTESGKTATIELTVLDVPPSGTCGENVTWKLDKEGTLTISGTGEMTTNPWGDSYCEAIKIVVIEDGVTSIGGDAFAGCSSLTSIVIPGSVSSIGPCAFSQCKSLTDIVIPDSVTGIGEAAFANCNSLTSIVIPASVTIIDDYAFSDCSSLTEITFNCDAPEIWDYTFDQVTATAYYPANNATWTADVMQNYGGTITWTPVGGEDEPELPVITGDSFDVSLPASGEVEYLYTPEEDGFYLFYFDREIWGIGFTVYKDGDESWVDRGDWENTETGNHGNSFELTGGVEYRIIVDNHWEEERHETVSIAKAVPYDTMWIEGDNNCYVGDEVFLNLRGTPDFSMEAAEWTVSDSNVVEITSSRATSLDLRSLSVGTVTVTATTESGKTATIELTVMAKPTSGTCGDNLTWKLDKEGTLTISGTGDMTRYSWDETPWQSRCDQIKKIMIKDGVTSIGDYAFNRCSNLTAIDIPDSVTSIRYGAFYGCSSLTGIDFPKGITSIASSLFEGCTGLKRVVIPASVTTICSFAFQGCIGMKDVTFEGNAPDEIVETAFLSVNATAYYPAGNPTWTADVMQNYGGEITWEPYGEPQVLEAPVVTITANESTGKPVVKWNTVDGAAKYRVYRSTKKTSGYELIYTGIKARSYTDKTAKAGTNYYYKVKAYHKDSSLNSDWSNVVNRVCDLAQPEVSITGNSTSGKPIVKWETVKGAVKYRVYRSTKKTSGYELVYTGISARSYTDKTAKAGTTYYYKVKAIHSKSSADSAYSDVVSRLCDLAKPEVIIKLKNGDPRLTWEKVDGAAKYYIYRATSKDGKYTKIKTTVSATSFTDTTAKAGVKYYYKVKAVHSNTDANSAYSSIKYITAK